MRYRHSLKLRSCRRFVDKEQRYWKILDVDRKHVHLSCFLNYSDICDQSKFISALSQDWLSEDFPTARILGVDVKVRAWSWNPATSDRDSE